MEALLKGKTALVTGAARGIGLAIGRRFADHGARVVIADMDTDEAVKAAAALPLAGEGRRCDVTNESDVSALVSGVIEDFGRLDILVNNAGITRDAMLHHMSLSDFRSVVDVHLQGAWLCTRAALQHMRAREGGGAIVNISSISGKIGNLGQANYAAAKAGLVALTKTTAREGARFAVRANAIQPGLIRTAMTATMQADMWDAKMEEIPLGRAGEPEEVADVALFLASPLSSYVTGAVVEATGGRHM